MAAKAASVGSKFTNRFKPLITYLQVKVPEKAGIIGKYAMVELSPPSPAEILKAPGDLSKIISKASTGGWKNTTVKGSVINAVVCFEIALWFFVGECIGKRALIGYQIEGAVNWEAHI